MEAVAGAPPAAAANAAGQAAILAGSQSAQQRAENMRKSMMTMHKNCKKLNEKYADVPHLIAFASKSKYGMSTFCAGNEPDERVHDTNALCDALKEAIHSHYGSQPPVPCGGGANGGGGRADAAAIVGSVLRGLKTEGKLTSRSVSEITTRLKGASLPARLDRFDQLVLLIDRIVLLIVLQLR
jgi:hypothetical protein